MTEPSYRVDPAQLREHASSLAAHARQLSSIGSGLPGEMSAQSLGSFAQFISTGLGAAMARTTDAFGLASSTVDAVAGGLRRAAEGYEGSDNRHAATLAGFGSSLEEDA